MSIFLYELINSLSTSEKVYFKRIIKSHDRKDNKNYLKIYNVFEGLKHYDKQLVQESFKGTTIEKYLSSEINYLKDKILITLFNFNMNRSKRNQIHKGILMVEVLAGKGFRKEALKKLKILKKSASKQEEFTWILRLIELEELIVFKEGIIGYKANLEELHQQRSKVTKTIQNLNKYHILRQEVRELQFSEHLLTNNLSALQDIYDDPLIANGDNCMSIKAKEHWYYTNVLLNYLQRNFDIGLKISADYVDFILKNMHMFDINKILPSLSNYIYHAALNKDKDHFVKGQKLLIDLSKQNKVPQSYIKYILHTRNLEFSYYADDENLTREYLDKTISLIDEDIAKFEEAQIQYLYMLIVRACIVLNKNDLGMYYSNLWHRRGVLAYKKVQARLFSIIVHLELDYLDLIQSEIILLKKLAKQNQREKMLIASFYTFIKSILKRPKQKSDLIKAFQEDLKLISTNSKEYYSFISFDYYQWSLNLN